MHHYQWMKNITRQKKIKFIEKQKKNTTQCAHIYMKGKNIYITRYEYHSEYIMWKTCFDFIMIKNDIKQRFNANHFVYWVKLRWCYEMIRWMTARNLCFVCIFYNVTFLDTQKNAMWFDSPMGMVLLCFVPSYFFFFFSNRNLCIFFSVWNVIIFQFDLSIAR